MPNDPKEFFILGDRYTLKETYYYDKLLVVTHVGDKGVTFENELEKVTNRLSKKTTFFFGWCGLQIYLDQGKFKKER